MSTPADDTGDVAALRAEVRRFVDGYRQLYPEPYSLPAHLQLAVRAIAIADKARAEADRLRKAVAAKCDEADMHARELTHPPRVLTDDLRAILAADPVSLADVREGSES